MISLWQALKNKKVAKPNHFCWADIWTFWYFDVSVWSDEKKWAFQGCAKIVLRLHTARTEKTDTPQTHPSASNVHEYHSDTSKHPPDIPQTPARYLQGVWDAKDDNRRQQTPPDTLKQHMSVSWGVWSCFFVSVGVWCCLLVPCVLWRSLVGVSPIQDGRCCGWHVGVSSWQFWNGRRQDVFLGYLGSQSLQYGAVTLFWHSPERPIFSHLTTPRHQNIKMSISQLNKNGWVLPFFVF